MKTITKSITLLFFISSILFACSENNDKDSDTNDTSIEVAEYITSSLTSENSGIIVEMNSSTSLAASAVLENLKSSTGDTIYSNDSTLIFSEVDNVYYSYYYELSTNYGIIIESDPTYSFYYNSVLEGSYNGQYLNSVEDRTGNWILTGLETSAEYYTLNGEIVRNGSSTRNDNTITSMSAIAASDINYDKETLEIVSGTLNWDISGNLNSTVFTYSVTVTFNDDKTADITIENVKYIIDLETGELE